MPQDYSDLPDEAFTETERAACVPNIYRYGNRQADVVPSKEIEANIEADEFAALLVEGVCTGGLEVEVESRSGPVYATVSTYAFDNRPDVPIPDLYLEVEHDLTIPVSFLINVLRSNDLPLISDSMWWAWDPADKLLKNDQFPMERRRHRAHALFPEGSLDTRQQQLRRVLHRALLSTDHGKKPVLLTRDQLDRAMRCEEVEFAEPRSIPSQTFGQYVLVFYDAGGRLEWLPLSDVAMLGYAVCTRSCAYYYSNERLLPTLNHAKLLASAYQIAVRYHPGSFQWYAVRKHGTMFHSIIERIDAPLDPRIPQPTPLDLRPTDWHADDFRTRQADTAQYVAAALLEVAAGYGPVYVTVSSHPLDDDLVTTPALYHYAVNMIYKHGYSIRYCDSGRAKAEKGMNWEA